MRTYVLPDFLPDSTNKLGYVRPPPTGLTPPPPPPPRLPTPPPEVVAMDEVVDSRMGRTKSKGKGRAVEESAQGEEEQLLQMNNERFTVPEVLFNPSTLGAFRFRFPFLSIALSPSPSLCLLLHSLSAPLTLTLTSHSYSQT